MAIRYYPKNRIKPGLKTTGGQFTLQGVEYIGTYYRTFDNKYYTGSDPYQLDANAELTPVDRITTSLRPETLQPVDDRGVLKELTPYYPKPTERDYQRGFFYRYFGKKLTDPSSVVEISKDSYTTLSSKNKVTPEDYLYEAIDILWKLTGPLYDQSQNGPYRLPGIIDTNKRIVEGQEPTFKGLVAYIGGNYSKFSQEPK